MLLKRNHNRELANQIHGIFARFLDSQPSVAVSSDDDAGDGHCETQERAYPPPLLLVSSEQSPAQDIQRFLATGADIVVGTPGRVEEFLLGKGRNVVNVKQLEVLVLDEADRSVRVNLPNIEHRVNSCSAC